MNRRAVRHGKPALLQGSIGPEGNVDIVGDHAGRGLGRVYWIDEASGGEMIGKGKTALCLSRNYLEDLGSFQNVKLAIGPFRKGENREPAVNEDPWHRVLVFVEKEARNLSGPPVSVNVDAKQFGDRAAAVDIASDDAVPLGVVVLDHGVDEPGRITGNVVVAVSAFPDAPAVVSPHLYAVHFLPGGVPDVPDPQLARQTIERPPVRLADSPGIHLRLAPSRGKGIVRGDPVGDPAVHVDPEDLAQDRIDVLRVRLDVGLAYPHVEEP